MDGMRLPAALLLSAVLPLTAHAAQATASPDDLIFQTNQGWSPRVHIEAQMVMVYGIDASMPQRIASWRDHGYRVAVMTGVAWGPYGDYLRGDFDGREHWNETQQEKSGKLILHSGREVPYISPSEPYGRYLSQGVRRALDAGAEAIYLEEPEFWARAGWSDAFKKEWQSYYHEPWQAPDSSPDAQYRASKLKYFLYRRALAQVFDSVKQWGQQHGKSIPCYVATHSLINYAQWQIVSPESSLLQVGADGYIAQVWTGTAREPNIYQGVRKERTFETAFLEYGALQNIARSSGKRIWYLNDPIEDNPNHSWTDYKRNWESTLVASLLQPHVSSYEILPWPDRIFGPKGLRPSTEPTAANPKPERVAISPAYETELQTVFHALGQMNQPDTHWKSAGTEGLGVLVSDTMMFQRAQPQPSDPALGSFYGLALPLLMRGMPVEPVQIESTYEGKDPAAFLRNYRLLLLTYEGQKPPSPRFHQAIATWVKAGGALVVVDDDKDPYNRAHDWWNSGQYHLAAPREDLFRQLGLLPAAQGLHHVGRGVVLYAAKSPAALTHDETGADTVRQLTHQAADAIHLPWHETGSLVLERGPFVIAAGLDASGSTPHPLYGTFVNLFDPHLAIVENPAIKPGDRALLLNPKFFPQDKPRILAASAKITNLSASANQIAFSTASIEGRTAKDLTALRLLLPKSPSKVTVDGQPLPQDALRYADGMLLVEFPAHAAAQKVVVTF
ncbi:hypothetical protein GWR55_13630 [Edaphobacter sp. 12200R-103]|nr:hypothetical protein GWR55_13630 [Edaphobacter sp. 12200R-103]